jgi:hypothetical protein
MPDQLAAGHRVRITPGHLVTTTVPGAGPEPEQPETSKMAAAAEATTGSAARKR